MTNIDLNLKSTQFVLLVLTVHYQCDEMSKYYYYFFAQAEKAKMESLGPDWQQSHLILSTIKFKGTAASSVSYLLRWSDTSFESCYLSLAYSFGNVFFFIVHGPMGPSTEDNFSTTKQSIT